MKRAISALGAIAAVAIGFLFAAPAQAQVTCTNVPSSLTTWPYAGFTKYCGTATVSDGSGMAGTLNSIKSPTGPAGHGGPQLASNSAKFMVFKNKTEYLTWFAQSGNNPDGAPTPVITDYATGYTHFVTGVTLPRYSVIFDEAKWGDGTARSVQGNYATAREVAFWFSRFYSTLLNSSTGKASDGFVFTNNLRIDRLYLNNQAALINGGSYVPCTVPGNIFGGHLDFLGQNICNGTSLKNPPYSGSNTNVLTMAWPLFNQNEQVFVEEVTERMGYNDQAGNRSVTYYLRNAQFECTRNMIGSIIKYGALIGNPASPLDLKGVQYCYSERVSTTGRKFELYGVATSFISTIINAYDALPASLRATVMTSPYYRGIIAWDPDVLRDLELNYPYNANDHADVRAHAAVTDSLLPRQMFFFNYFQPTGTGTFSYLPMTANYIPVGVVAHEAEHINQMRHNDPAVNDAAFSSAYTSEIAAVRALPANNPAKADLLAAFDGAPRELFSEIGSIVDTGNVSINHITKAWVQTYFPNSYARFVAQRNANNW